MTTPRRAAAAKKEMEGALTTAFTEHREAFTKVFKRSSHLFTRDPMWHVKGKTPARACLHIYQPRQLASTKLLRLQPHVWLAANVFRQMLCKHQGKFIC